MKSFLATCVALLVIAAATSASAAQPVKSKALAKLGLSNMKIMSDRDGEQVRGKFAIASVSGYSTSNVFGQTGANSYTATSLHQSGAAAGGASLSVSGVGGAIGPFSGFVVGGSAGFSAAFAK